MIVLPIVCLSPNMGVIFWHAGAGSSLLCQPLLTISLPFFSILWNCVCFFSRSCYLPGLKTNAACFTSYTSILCYTSVLILKLDFSLRFCFVTNITFKPNGLNKKYWYFSHPVSKLGGVLIWVDLAWLGGIGWSLSHVFQWPRCLWGDGTDLAECLSFFILW